MTLQGLWNYDGTAMATTPGFELPVANPKMHSGMKQGCRWTQLQLHQVHSKHDYVIDLRKRKISI